MADLNIDDFYRDSALIMLQLYSHFPRKTILYVDDICGPDTPDEFGLHTERYQSCFSAMAWLAEQGYIQYYETIREEALDQAVLSQKAFMALSTRSELELGIGVESGVESAVEEDSELASSIMERSLTNITQIRLALREGSSIMTQQVMHYFLSL